MNERKLKRLFPHASKTFIERNKDQASDPGSPDKSKSLDRDALGEGERKETLDSEYRLSHVEVEFYAAHGKQLDQDNRRYIAKPLLDALVSLGFAKDDKEITSEVTQRQNDSDLNI